MSSRLKNHIFSGLSLVLIAFGGVSVRNLYNMHSLLADSNRNSKIIDATDKSSERLYGVSLGLNGLACVGGIISAWYYIPKSIKKTSA